MNPEWRRSQAYMTIMNVTAAAPKAVSTSSVLRGVAHGSVQVEGEGDRIEGALMLCPRYRDDQPPSIRLPAQLEERAARPLNVEQLVNKLRVCVLIETDHQASPGAVGQAGTSANLPVALVLHAQTGIVKSTAWCHRKSGHADSLTTPDERLGAHRGLSRPLSAARGHVALVARCLPSPCSDCRS